MRLRTSDLEDLRESFEGRIARWCQGELLEGGHSREPTPASRDGAGEPVRWSLASGALCGIFGHPSCGSSGFDVNTRFISFERTELT